MTKAKTTAKSKQNAATISPAPKKASSRTLSPKRSQASTREKASAKLPPAASIPAGATPGARVDSKQAQIIAMLRGIDGTTIQSIMQTTGWQQHSVRGFLAGVVRKKLRLHLDSELVDGTRRYRIAAAAAGEAGKSAKAA